MEDMTWFKDIKPHEKSFIIRHVYEECSQKLREEVNEAEEMLGVAMIIRFLSEMGTIIGCGYYTLYWIRSWERIKAKKKSSDRYVRRPDILQLRCLPYGAHKRGKRADRLR